MLTRLIALVRKELLATARDRQTRFIVLIAPPLLLLIYVFAITQDVSNIAIGVVDRDPGRYSREIVDRVAGSPSFTTVRHFETLDQMAAAIDAQQILLGLQFESDFSRRVLRGVPATAQVVIDGRRSNAGQIASGYISRIVQGYNLELMVQAGIRPPSTVVARTWFNPNGIPVWSATPSLFAVMAAIVGFMVSALAIARERELGTFDQLLVSPLTPLEILVGKTLPALIIAVASSAVMLAFAALLLSVPIRGNLGVLLLTMTIYLSAIIGIGLFISSLVRTQQQAFIGMFIYLVPAVLLSGYATPVANMPGWLQVVAETGPITHFIVISKGIFLKDMPLSDIWTHTWPLLLNAAFTLSAGAWFFRRRMG